MLPCDMLLFGLCGTPGRQTFQLPFEGFAINPSFQRIPQPGEACIEMATGRIKRLLHRTLGHESLSR